VPGDWDVEADVVVVGFGAAGACAALEAASAGGSVLVLDRFGGGGATALSGGVVYAGGGTPQQRAAGVTDSPGAMFGYLRTEVGDAVPTPTLREFCDGRASRLICRVCRHRGHQLIANTPAGAFGSGTSLPPEIQPKCPGSFQSNQCCAWPSVESTGTSPSYEPTEGAERYKMPLGCPVAKESCSTSRRYQGCPGWLGSGGTGVSATAVRVDPSELMSAVYTQTVQRAPWLNSRWQ
jgi:FAD binding domain